MSSNNLKSIKWKFLIKDLLGLSRFQTQKNSIHLKEAGDWLMRAQDATADRGVSRTFNLRSGWEPSYPETTGYIIPTLIDYAKFTGNDEYKRGALEMADWEVDIQLDCGAIQAGTIAASPKTPTIFNTGQVLFGWVSAFKQTGEGKYHKAATRAANWLLDVQEPDGSWVRFASPFARFKRNTYNSRTAWGIYQVYQITENSKYLDASVKNIRYVLKRQNPQGWFENNCLVDNSRPLTHTIGYTLEGLLGVGIPLGEQSFIDAAETAARALIEAQAKNGSIPGCLDSEWHPAVRWICLTGLAQIAVCWWRLYQITNHSAYREAALKANQYLKSTQNLSSAVQGIRGGIKGSHPISGKYCSYSYPNWAVKFFMDSLLLEEAHSLSH